jgi:hypothetical protein
MIPIAVKLGEGEVAAVVLYMLKTAVNLLYAKSSTRNFVYLFLIPEVRKNKYDSKEENEWLKSTRAQLVFDLIQIFMNMDVPGDP